MMWSHYREVLSLKNINEIRYYLNERGSKNLTIKQLQLAIKTHEYNRLSCETKNKSIMQENLKINDLIPNPIIIKLNDNNEKLTEFALKQTILNNLDEFLLQLGTGFCYIGNEFKIRNNNL